MLAELTLDGNVVVYLLAALFAVGQALSIYKEHFRTSPNPSDVYVTRDTFHEHIHQEESAASERRNLIYRRIEDSEGRLRAELHKELSDLKREFAAETTGTQNLIRDLIKGVAKIEGRLGAGCSNFKREEEQ